MRAICNIGVLFVVCITLGACDRADRQALEDKVALLEAENSRLRLDAQNADAAGERYDECLADANSAYVTRWDSSCARQRGYDLRQRQQCKDGGGSDSYCAAIEVRPAKNCSLPSELAASYDANYESDQRLCMERLKLGR